MAGRADGILDRYGIELEALWQCMVLLQWQQFLSETLPRLEVFLLMAQMYLLFQNEIGGNMRFLKLIIVLIKRERSKLTFILNFMFCDWN